MIDETFGERVARLCDERGVSRNAMRRACGTNVALLDRTRSVSERTARAIADALGMTLADLDAPVWMLVSSRRAIDCGLLTEEPHR